MLLSDLSLIPILQKLGIYFAFSEKVNILNRILSLVHAENIVSVGALADGKANVVEMKVSHNSELIGVPLSHLSSSLPKDLLIAVIENKGQVMVGKGKRILSPNDTLILLTSPTRIHELQALF
jgi:trk system potassium uptake protein TrkA